MFYELLILIRNRVLDLDSRFETRSVKFYIGFKIESNNIIEVKIRNSKFILGLLGVEPKDLNDPEKRTKYVNNSFKYYIKHITQFGIESEDEIDDSMLLIKQVYT